MGVPLAQQTFADDIKWFPVDNENSNTGTITALPVRLNYACRLEHDWLVRHGLRTGVFVEKKIVGCGLHVLNLCDVLGSEMWRKVTSAAAVLSTVCWLLYGCCMPLSACCVLSIEPQLCIPDSI
jgi:hypothetical protein